SGVSGYFLYGWCVHNKYPNYTKFFEGDRYPAVGVINGTIETIVAWTGLEPGTGADGTGKLATFYFTSKSETAYSPIEITKAFYYTSLNSPDPDKKEPDIIINGYYNEPPIINMIGHSAWPEHHNHPTSKHGWDITLFARIRNDGPTTTYGKVVFETVDSAGFPVMSPPETDPIELVPGDPAVKVNVTWTIPGWDRYYMTARVYVDLDGNLATSDWTRGTDKPKTFTFNVKP
ncbi:MAG: hypothetical protein GWO26_17105, partial [Phycisphaerae bacterium]|nr:hypothetical protein [Phycisphaerae bacterium]